jgi:hypothetical protein
VGDSS